MDNENQNIPEPIDNGEMLNDPRQIKNGVLRWQHFGPMAETATAAPTTAIEIGPINGKYFILNVKEK
jgi:hypothetical protein